MHYESLSRHPLLAGISQPSFKKNTIKTYKSILSKLTVHFGKRDLNSLVPEEVLSFLTDINQGTKQQTKRTRYSQLTSFFTTTFLCVQASRLDSSTGSSDAGVTTKNVYSELWMFWY